MTSNSGYLAEDTIAAISTATGGAIAIIRISGPQAFSIVSSLCQDSSVQSSEPRKMVRTLLQLQNGTPIDDALVVRFIQPHSYTGEDLIELHLHGSTFIASRTLEAILSAGARQALPGEFSFRAVRNGRLTLFQAQAIVDLLAAQTETATALALEKLNGSQNNRLQTLGKKIRTLAASAELSIDFADQDIEELSLKQLKQSLLEILEFLNTLQASYFRGACIQNGISLTLLGLPNAGKSSFFNCLLGEDRSIVTSIAGTTRDIIRETLVLRNQDQSVTFRIEDTAGLRSTQNIIEQLGIEKTYQSAEKADVILFLVDPTQPPEETKAQWNILKSHRASTLEDEIKVLGVFTKADLITPENQFGILAQYQELNITDWVFTSSKTQIGISEAIKKLIELTHSWTQREQGELILTRLDHYRATQEAIFHLNRAQSATDTDLFAADIRHALHSLAPLIGETVSDDILGQIFSDFCIGK